MPFRTALPRQAVIPLIIACALFMETLDATVIATALPAIARSLGESPLVLNLAITSYLLSLAVFIPISGWVADRFGARRVFAGAIIVFVIGSIGCGLSDSLGQLVAARMVQGLGGAMMVPVGRLVILRSVEKSKLVQAMAFLTVPALLGPVLGPPLGGFLTTYVSWRWIFWINVPIGCLGLLLAVRLIPNLREESVPPLDLGGFLLAGLGLAGLVFGFETLGRAILPDWQVALLLCGGLAAVLLYLLHARRRAHPLIDLSLLRLQTFRAAVLGGGLFRIAMGAIPFLLPMMLQLGFGLTAFESGLLTFASAVGALFMKMTAGPILRRFGFRTTLLANALLCALFLASYGFFTPLTPHWLMIALLLVGGFFRSLQFTGVNTIAYDEVERRRMSAATSFTAMAQQLSLSLGVGVGAMTLHIALETAGRTLPTAGDFAVAFFTIAIFAVLSALPFLRLPADAGHEISGRAVRQPAE